MPHPGRGLVKLILEARSRRNHDYADLTRPEQVNVLIDHRATCWTQYLRAVGQTTAFYPLPACRGYLRDATGHITSREQRTLGTVRASSVPTKPQQLGRPGL
jgi:hypothetical protein